MYLNTNKIKSISKILTLQRMQRMIFFTERLNIKTQQNNLKQQYILHTNTVVSLFLKFDSCPELFINAVIKLVCHVKQVLAGIYTMTWHASKTHYSSLLKCQYHRIKQNWKPCKPAFRKVPLNWTQISTGPDIDTLVQKYLGQMWEKN